MPKVNVALQSLDKSKLWKRLDEELKPKVRKTAEQAAARLKTVIRHMPLYTFHNERHVLNVIGWMDWLLGDVLKSLAPLEAALCLLAAYTHDLGMALPEAEHAKLLKGESPEFQRFRDQFPEHRRHIDRLRKEGHYYGAQVIEDHLVTDFLRKTHADDRPSRLRAHLDGMAQDAFTYGRIDFRRELELIAISHNQPVAWLRHELGDGIRAAVDQTSLNFAFPGLVLRLADIMDFDASRTPGILFHHLGLENRINLLDAKAKEISEREWRKHMAITGVLPENGKLIYEARHCPDPVTEKCIRQFVGWIRVEVDGVRGELPRIGARAGLEKLRLPEVENNITPKPGAYVYHDWSFQLDHEEIVNLLMGEALYGDPSLCIRELLQNALDAVELRDLRLQFKQKSAGVETTPGKFRDALGAEHEFAVNLTWGHHETKGWWIQVSDNGVGMTEDTVKRYFTRLGKSSYRSPEFKAEQEAMRREGLLCTPISTFGIGVLSCFMIADRIEVKTNAGPGEKALDFHVSGPGSLFWANAGSRKEQGTDVRIWLKEGQALGHDWNRCLEALREHFGYAPTECEETEPEKIAYLDPCEVAARHVVWPKYPVHVDVGGGQRRTIDHLFHVNVLAPLDVEKLLANAKGWNIPLREEHAPAWGIQDWTDPETGSRIRLWLPQVISNDPSTCVSFWKLATLSESSIEQGFSPRQRVLVQSMFVKDLARLEDALELAAAPGCRVWLDLRGTAAPRLRVDRTAPCADGESSISEICRRFLSSIKSLPVGDLLLFGMTKRSRAELAKRGAKPSSFELERETAFTYEALNVEAGVERARAWAFIRDEFDPPDFRLARDPNVESLDFEAIFDEWRHRPPRLTAGAPDHWVRSVAGSISVPDSDLAREWRDKWPHFVDLLRYQRIQEGFFPTLHESWPPLGLYGRDGMIGDAYLAAPAACKFAHQHCSGLDRRDYDLCFPLAAIPLSHLREKLPAWKKDRNLRRVAVAALLFPGNPNPALGKQVGLDSLYAFLPAYELWWKPFADWTEDDERHGDNLSLLWNLATGEILAYPGLIRRDEMRHGKKGVKTFLAYLKVYIRSRRVVLSQSSGRRKPGKSG